MDTAVMMSVTSVMWISIKNEVKLFRWRQDRTIVRLDHIFTGCYCFRLATYRDDSIRTARQLVDRPRLMQTDVIEYDVFKWNLSLDLSATSNQ